MDQKTCGDLGDQLGRIDEELLVWGRTFQRYYSEHGPGPPSRLRSTPTRTVLRSRDVDVYADAENWDAESTEAAADNG